MSKSFEVVPFHQHEILTVREDDDILVPLKPVVEALGLMWHPQLERVKRHPVLSQGIRVTRIPSQGGMQETVALTLEMVPGFLTTIQSERIKEPEVRERVVLFQKEAFHTLFVHFFGGRRKDVSQIEHSDRTARRRELPGLLDRMERESHPEKRRIYHAIVVQNCEANGIVPPALDAIAPPTANEDAQADALLQRIDALIAERPALNHHRRPDLIAINRPELDQQGLPMASRMLRPLRRHPRFVMTGQVNGRDKSWACWVFRAA